jgi:hypothetical protein
MIWVVQIKILLGPTLGVWHGKPLNQPGVDLIHGAELLTYFGYIEI